MTSTGRNKKLRWAALGAAVLGMGFTMPSCPGQRAMQDQLDQVKASQADSTKRVQMMESQVKVLRDEMAQVKQVVIQMNTTIQEQKQAMVNLDKAFNDLQQKMAKPAPAAKALPKKKKGR